MRFCSMLLWLLLISCNSIAGIRLDDGSLASAGDDISLVYTSWGREAMRVRSERTCNRIIRLKKEYCSTKRLIWQREGRYLMVQLSGSMIIKTGWTRSARRLKERF